MTNAATIVIRTCCESMALACMLRKIAHQQLLVSALLLLVREVRTEWCHWIARMETADTSQAAASLSVLHAAQHCCWS